MKLKQIFTDVRQTAMWLLVISVCATMSSCSKDDEPSLDYPTYALENNAAYIEFDNHPQISYLLFAENGKMVYCSLPDEDGDRDTEVTTYTMNGDVYQYQSGGATMTFTIQDESKGKCNVVIAIKGLEDYAVTYSAKITRRGSLNSTEKQLIRSWKVSRYGLTVKVDGKQQYTFETTSADELYTNLIAKVYGGDESDFTKFIAKKTADELYKTTVFFSGCHMALLNDVALHQWSCSGSTVTMSDEDGSFKGKISNGQLNVENTTTYTNDDGAKVEEISKIVMVPA